SVVTNRTRRRQTRNETAEVGCRRTRWSQLRDGSRNGMHCLGRLARQDTSFEFVRAMKEGSVEERSSDAQLLIVILESIGVQQSAFQEDAVILKPRSFQDLLLSRQTFTVRGVPYEFTASRGIVSYTPTEAP